MAVTSWGHHVMLNIARCRPASIRCPIHIGDFSRRLVTAIDMKPYGEPQVVMFGEGNKRGYTLIQLIETSNIAGHFCEESNNAYLDVFSCKPFDYGTVEAMVGQYFEPERIQAITMRRDADIKGIPWVDRILYRELT